MTKKQERRKWALETAAALLQSDMDCFDVTDVEDEDEADKRRDAVREIAEQLAVKAKRIRP